MGIQWFFENPTGTRRRFAVVRSLLMRCNKDSTYLWGLLLWYWIPESHSAHWIPVKIRPLLCRKKDIPDYCNIGVFSGHP